MELAEDEGFEPSIGFPIHAFQACALGRYANPPDEHTILTDMTTRFNRVPLRFKNQNSKLFYVVFSICLFAIKFIFVITRESEKSFMTFDSEGYLDLSKFFPSSFLVPIDESLKEMSLLRTPGYPIFLWILNENPVTVALIQCSIQILMAYVAVLIYREVYTRSSIRQEKIVFALVSVETSLTVHSFFLLSDLLFAFFISLFMFFLIKSIKVKETSNITLLLAALVMIIAVAIRPVGIVLFVYLPLLAMTTREFKKIMLLLCTLVVWTAIWSGYNYLRADIFTYSTIQNHNLLMFEGAGAKAESQGINLRVSQKEELQLREQVIGSEVTLNKTDSYSFERGIQLITENFDGFVKMHFLGMLKIVYGPNQGEAIRFLTAGERVRADSDLEKLLVTSMFILTFLIGTTSIFALLYFIFVKGIGSWIAQLTIIFMIFSSGSQAYGRFRAPIAVFMVVLSVGLVARLLHRTTGMSCIKLSFRERS